MPQLSSTTVTVTATQYYEPRVRDLMTREPVSLSEGDTIRTLAELMKWRSIRHVPVTDVDQRLVGLITHRDLLTISVSKLAHIPETEQDTLFEHVRIGDVMGRKVTTVEPETSLTEAAELMYQHKFGCLPVTEEGKLVGILTEADFVRAFIDREARFRGR